MIKFGLGFFVYGERGHRFFKLSAEDKKTE
jgi:hypothetical protein